MPFSTGVIGEPLPFERITRHIATLSDTLNSDGIADAARAIMTTDTFPKLAWAEVGDTGSVVLGMAKGAGVGTVPVEVGHVPINIPIPIVREIGMIVGGIAGVRERTVQDMRDRMVDDLASAVDQPLSNIALATDVYWGLRNVANVEIRLLGKPNRKIEGTTIVPGGSRFANEPL